MAKGLTTHSEKSGAGHGQRRQSKVGSTASLDKRSVRLSCKLKKKL
jgi:hypothetical protein